GAKTAKVKIISNSGGSQEEFIFTVSGTAADASSESRLSSLTFTKGKLDQQFHADIKSYTLKVDAAETIIKVTPATLNANITSLTVNGKTQSSGVASEDIILAYTSAITIVVTAEKEDVSSTYTITIQSVVNYSSTALSQFWISNMAGDDVEDMATAVNNYDDFDWQSLPDTTQLKFKPVLVNSNATIKLNGTAIAHNTYTNGYNLTSGAATTNFTFTVISEDGENERSFMIPCFYLGTQWEKVGDFPISISSYYLEEFTVVTHNNQFILTNANEVFASPTGTSWTKTVTLDNTIDHYQHSSVVYNNTIYNIGGVKKSGQNWIIANIVSHSTNGTNFTVAPSVSGLTGGVQNHTSVVFNGAIYTMGGRTQTADETNAVWRSTNGTTWTKQTNPSWSARAGHTSVVYNNKLYVMGGYYGGTSEHRDVWSSSNGTTWIQETASAAWTGRNDHTVNANSKGMWLFGGNDGYFEKDLWFSPDGKTWTKVLDVPFAERATHAAVVRDGYLYVFGGVNGSWENPNYLTDIWRTYIGE
ncbi:MAG: cadherin-like beta sandwich domain-containing protein, partial [Treponema sp.]|nr:cadherin-like beta sandwich domain-containing protein [Treponema sp.]